MKKLYQKIIVSILSLAVMGTVCAMAPVMAEATGTETPTQMYFDKTYQALWTAYPDIVSEKSTTVAETKAQVSTQSVGQRPTECFGVSSANAPEKPLAYQFTEAGAYVVIDLPQKDDYELKTVEVTVSQGTKTYASQFDYYYSTDGADWTKVENFAYTINTIGSTHTSYYNAFCETIKVPATATKFKVVRNNSEYTQQGSSDNSGLFGYYPGVMGFEFAYIPKTNNDTITVEAKNNSDIISFLSSGMLPDGENKWTRQATTEKLEDGSTAEYGLSLSYYGNGTSYTSTLNAIDGYNITSFSAKFDNKGNSGRNIKITLGSKTITPQATSGKQQISVTDENGADKITFNAPQWTNNGLTNIVITMEKIKLQTSIDSAVDNGTEVTATATVSNLGLAEDDSMVLIVAGYDGTRFMGAQTKTVSKSDEDGTDSLTATLPTGTKTVKVFLWKDLDTLGIVLAPIELAVTTAVTE